VNLYRPAASASGTLKDGDTITVGNTRPALDLSAVFNNLRPLIQSTNPQEINTVSRAVLKIFRGREGDLASILGNVGNLTETLAAHDQRLARLVTDFNQVTKILNDQGSSIKTAVTKFGELMQSLARVTPTISRVVDELNQASTKFGGLVQRNKANLDAELRDLNTILNIVNQNLGPLNTVAANLKEILLATARSQSYGTWWNLYVVSLCPELGAGGCTGIVGGGSR
jgi:phospholipid/cholesterol/gamma-HCH transport system substrate-binding protein